MSSESDDPYIPSMLVHSSDSESVTIVESEEEFEVEDDIKVDDVDVVEDQFDAFDGSVWDDQCDNFDSYLAKLYNNRELYVDKGFGNIEIKEWQIFTHKQHLRDVIRDYCI